MTPAYLIDVGAGIAASIPAGHRLTRRDMADLQFAMVTCGEGFGDIGRRAVREMEGRAERRVAAEARHHEQRQLAGSRSLLAVAAAVGVLSRRIEGQRAARARRIEPPKRPDVETDSELLRKHYADRLEVEHARIVEAKKIPDRNRRETVIKDAAKSRAAIVQALADLDARDYLKGRAQDLAGLEALRGGEVIVKDVVIHVPVLKTDGTPRYRGGRAVTKPYAAQSVTLTARDGLETLSTAHLKADGSPRTVAGQDLVAVFTANEEAALRRYRIDFEEGDAGWSLKAVDTTNAGGDRTAYDPARSTMDVTMVGLAHSVGKLKAHDLAVRKYAGQTALVVLRAVAGEGRTIHSLAPGRRKAIRLTKELLKAANVLADRYGLQ